MQALIIHLQAPLMSFGGPQIDQIGPTGQFPTISQITGLFANAIGYTHGDFDRLDALQTRLSLASALLRDGDELEDYQTVDLGQAHLRHPAWTTRGHTEHRGGGPDARYGTHIRFRRYRADANVLSAVSLSPGDTAPTLNAVAGALMAPARPLFIGRKACLPATPLLVGIMDDATDLADALSRVPTVFPNRWVEIAGKLGSEESVRGMARNERTRRVAGSAFGDASCHRPARLAQPVARRRAGSPARAACPVRDQFICCGRSIMTNLHLVRLPVDLRAFTAWALDCSYLAIPRGDGRGKPTG